MPSISQLAERHAAVHREPGRYLCFPDVCVAGDGSLVCAYLDADAHVSTERRLLSRVSSDGGRTWGRQAVLNPDGGICPRLSMPGGRLVCIDERRPSVYRSPDNGLTWTMEPAKGLKHHIYDRILEIPRGHESHGGWLTTGHDHRGAHAPPLIRQAPSEQMAYLSTDRGRTWKPLSVLAFEKCLVLCETSVCALPDGRLLALARENSFVGEPMYAVTSADGGLSWSDPVPTPLVGHRPTVDVTASGELLVTFRNVAPAGGTAAWLGSEEALLSGPICHGLHPAARSLRLEDGAMVLDCRHDSAGPKADHAPDHVLFLLPPVSHPASARAVLRARVRSVRGGLRSCCLRLGCWWRILPGRIRCDAAPDLDVPLDISQDSGRMHDLRLTMQAGRVELAVDGRVRATVAVDPDRAEARPVAFGTGPKGVLDGSPRGRSLWESVSLRIDEPRLGLTKAWRWRARRALPDARAGAGILELAASNGIAWADYGYSGWVETKPGRFVCVYHHADPGDPDYKPGHTSYVRATRFTVGDFR